MLLTFQVFFDRIDLCFDLCESTVELKKDSNQADDANGSDRSRD